MTTTHRRWGPVVAICLLFASSSYVVALNSSLDIRQYAHTAWRIDDGFGKGIIRALAQTTDGYLWLGTEFGLLKFDGVRTVPWEPPADQPLPSSDVRSLQAGRDGRLWIGTFRGLASWKDRRLTTYPELNGMVIEALLEDHDRNCLGWRVGAVSRKAVHGPRLENGVRRSGRQSRARSDFFV